MVGDILRKEREKQRMTISEVEEGTSIRASYIEAIESGAYDKMPGRVYAKGFIKNYANFLNLNGEEIVKQFMSEVAPVVEPVEVEDVAEESKNKGKTFSVSGRRLEEVGSKISGNHLVAAIMVIALLIGGFFYFNSSSGVEVAQVETTKPQEITTTQTETVTPAPETATASAPVTESVVTTPVSAAPAPQVDGVNLQATFSGDCWMSVTVDGAVVYEGMMNAGQVMDWKGNQNVTVRVGNAGAVDFVMNGQNFGKLGGDGDVVDRNFTR